MSVLSSSNVCSGVVLLLMICHCAPSHYTNEWAVLVKDGEEVARQLAAQHGFLYVSKILDDYYLFRHKRVSKRSVISSDLEQASLEQEPQVLWLEQQVARKRVKRGVKQFNDPKWPRMWYLDHNSGQGMNVLSAWAKGYTGRGVVVSILDDGIEKNHPDLKKNYDRVASYDFIDRDPDPMPRYDEEYIKCGHGTRCAGVVAAEANNNICIVGVAYDAGIGGVRMLDGDVTDAVEAESLSFNPQHIDIFSASWGPDDDGQTVDGPGPLVKRALVNGVTQGRRGLGSIFIWASGNGGKDSDNCNCDGYSNSIYTLAISSSTEKGERPWYSEPCSSTLATTYSSGFGTDRQIVTTDLRKGCTESHTGTSASAPIAAGLFALLLQANPSLSWRDVQHIVVLTSRPSNLEANDWATNGIGRRVSHSFGYGLMDVDAMINVSKNWRTVPPQRRCEVVSRPAARGIPVNGNVELALLFDGCRGTDNAVVFAEHVQAVITLTASRRGEVEIYLTSPSGTRSMLLGRRPRDISTEGFTNWPFLTTHSWGERVVGTWRLEVRNTASVFYQAKLEGWTLVVHGTSHHPYVVAPSTARPSPSSSWSPVFVNRIASSTANPKASGNSQNVLRARFLHSENKAVKLGPCPRPPQVQQQPVNSFTSNDLSPVMSVRGKDSRGNKEVAGTLRSWSLVVMGVSTPSYLDGPESTTCRENLASSQLRSSVVRVSSFSMLTMIAILLAVMLSVS